MTKRSFAWAALVMLATTASCGAILGLDQDYKEGKTAASSGSGGSGGDGSASSSSGSDSGSSSSSGGGASAVPPASCVALSKKCGANVDEYCCQTLPVEGGDFLRDNRLNFPASVSSFSLDRFEVTVGRFRKFVEAYPESKPKEGSGKNPHVTGDIGWSPTFNEFLPAVQSQLKVSLVSCPEPNASPSKANTWTDSIGANEQKPINCVSYFEAYAFCIWDGGRLPTELEWSYAAEGGAEERAYPWGNVDPSLSVIVVNCEWNSMLDCVLADIPNVGSLPGGDARWKQADMAGSMYELVRDTWVVSYPPPPCKDCATLTVDTQRVIRGGSWFADYTRIATDTRFPIGNAERYFDVGFRCARD